MVRKVNNQRVRKVNNQLDTLAKLADVLLQRRFGPNRDDLLVVPLIGAGASLSAGLPTGAVLQESIYRELVPSDEIGGTFDTPTLFIEEVLNTEASKRFGQKAM